MRLTLLLGIVLLGLGAYVLGRGLTYSSRRDVLKIGDLQASLEERRAIPPWAGGVAIAAGLGLIILSARRR